MDLYNLALSYKNQFLDNYYVLRTDQSEIIIYSKPFNFLHLTGLQRCPALPQYNKKEDFYYDCLHHKYPNIGWLINSIKNKGEKNITNIKVCYFNKLQQTILNSKYLYIDGNDRCTCSIVSSNNKQRFQTCIFTYNSRYNCFMPKSNQVDIDEKYSCAAKYEKQIIIFSECIARNSNKGKEIFNTYLKKQ